MTRSRCSINFAEISTELWNAVFVGIRHIISNSHELWPTLQGRTG